jgi:hypothetical protein
VNIVVLEILMKRMGIVGCVKRCVIVSRGQTGETMATQLMSLFNEFKDLKQKLFGQNMFVVLDDKSEDVKRYNQLLGYFFPQFRTSDWVSPV